MFGFLFGRKTENISPREAKERLSANNNIILLDVRTPEEYMEIHIPHSISLPLNELKSGIAKAAENKDAEIIVYCQSGIRAAKACNQLTSMGYTNICSMGGIQSWKYETERG